MDLPKPYEILELADGQKMTFHVKGWEQGTIRIFPKDWEGRVQVMIGRGQISEDLAREYRQNGKPIDALRVVVPREEMPPGKMYWDITATTLIAQILPSLQRPDFKEKTFMVTAHGIAPAKRFTLEVS